VLADAQQLIAATAERAGEAVVGLGRGWGMGSGIVVAEGRVLVPARRVGEEPALRFADGRRERGRLLAADPELGLALVEADTGDAEPLRPGDAEPEPPIGTAVVALANPGGRGLRATLGFVSSGPRRFRAPRGGRLLAGIEHTAPLPQGSAGGPLLGAEGTLIGINLARLPGGLILALAAGPALGARIDALAHGEQPARPRLGVAVAPPRVARRLRRAVGLPERDGLLVRAVEPGSPAERAGLRTGDLIVAAGGPVTSVDDLYAALDRAGEEPLALGIVRGTEELGLTVELAANGKEARR